MITVFEERENHFLVIYENGAIIGSIYMEVDGYYVWQPSAPVLGMFYEGGFLDEPILYLLADTLTGMNEEWNKESTRIETVIGGASR